MEIIVMDIEIGEAFARRSNDETVRIETVTDTQVTYIVDETGITYISSIERFAREFTKLI